ncbi:MAG: hypothetical protein JRF30_10350 [Deltaproteobacteria bacterium]|nr:hypothetical protein [Deltaproteobacteria bacterium]MBW2035730.1 hypothetical protein [Deltaproteobacteria bacterium]MBW2331297.1 hypothetical protein [Deltaproteobacteria bacterium]
MLPEYPEIITELIEKAQSDKLRHFDLSSFMSDKPLEEVFGKIDRTMQFFSVYVFMELLEDDLWEDERYAEKEEVHLCSRVEEEARKHWWDRNREHLKLIDERMESLKIDPEYKDMKEGDLRDKVIEDLNREIYPQMIARLKEEYQWMYEDEWEEYWKKEEPFKERVEYRYHRRYEMPRPFSHWDGRNAWQQYYFGKDQAGVFYYAQGGSGSSGQRYNHGFYGHLFALLNSEAPVPTCFFTYDSHNRFIFHREEKSLWLNSFDLVGNFRIDWKESERILKDVNRIDSSRVLT